jgi:hypothetical protein
VEEVFLNSKPGAWAKLQLRWRVWRRETALMQAIAYSALTQAGACDESDSLIRIAWDRDSGGLIVMIYLSHFDHAAWTMSRHIEGYLTRQFKGLYGISVHSVHMDVVRARAFKEMPPIKSGSSLRAILRERRNSDVKSTGTTGRRIAATRPQREEDDAFPATYHMGLDELPRPGPRAKPEPDPALSRARSPKAKTPPLITEEYLSEPGYEISEVNFEEFLNSMPSDSRMQSGAPDSGDPTADVAPAPKLSKSGEPPPFLAESDLMKQERR